MNDSVKTKITKLLAMASDGRGNENEAEIALRIAEKLMRQHGIDAADLQESTGEKPAYNWTKGLVPIGYPTPVSSAVTWAGVMAYGVGVFTDTKSAYVRTPTQGICMEFAGDVLDVEYATWLYAMLRDDCRKQSAEFVGTRSEREAFRRAYSARVQERMFALRRERTEALRQHVTSTSTALVVVENKLVLRDAEFGKQRKSSSRSYGSYSDGYARDAGRAAGNRANFSRPLGSNGNAGLLR